MHLVAGHDAIVASWISERVGAPISPPYTALGWIDDEAALRVGFVFYRYEVGGNIDFTLAASGRLTRGILGAVADYVFNHAGCRRMTSRPLMANERHCRLLERAGFKREAVLSDYYGEGEHAVQYRLLKRQCRWLSSD